MCACVCEFSNYRCMRRCRNRSLSWRYFVIEANRKSSARRQWNAKKMTNKFAVPSMCACERAGCICTRVKIWRRVAAWTRVVRQTVPPHYTRIHMYVCVFVCVCVHDVCCELLFARLEKNNLSKFSQRVEFVVVSSKLISAVVCCRFCVFSIVFSFFFGFTRTLRSRRCLLRRRVVVISQAIDVVNDDAGGDTYSVQSPKVSDCCCCCSLYDEFHLTFKRERERGDRGCMHCLTRKAILAAGSFDLQAMWQSSKIIAAILDLTSSACSQKGSRIIKFVTCLELSIVRFVGQLGQVLLKRFHWKCDNKEFPAAKHIKLG